MIGEGTKEQSSNNKFALDSKYKGLETNIWTELSRLYKKEEGINLGQGFPDYQPAKDIVAELAKVCEGDSSLHQYTRGQGHIRLVRALASLYSRLLGNGIQLDPYTDILVTAGAYGALFYAVMANVGAGDEVILIEPYFDCYEPLVKLAGGTAVFVELKQTDPSSTSSASWKLDSKELKAAFNERTKAIIVNTPNNPLGKMFTREELTVKVLFVNHDRKGLSVVKEIADLCKEFNVLVISDEVYEWMIYDENEHVRIATLDGMWDRTITIGSAGKTFSLTGWKIGWAYGPEELLRNLCVAHENCLYLCQTPEQEAIGAALEHQLTILTEETCFFKRIQQELLRKREFWKNAVLAAGMKPIIPEGGYFMLVDWSKLEPKPDLTNIVGNEEHDVKFVKWLATNWKLHGIPPSAFYSQNHKTHLSNYIRFNFYKKDETLEKAQEILLHVAKAQK